jgi:hypothetical protein
MIATAMVSIQTQLRISCNPKGFLYLNTSPDAIASHRTPTGIGGGQLEIGVVGPLARRTENGKLIINPDGVYRKKLAFAESAHRVIATTSRAMQ